MQSAADITGLTEKCLAVEMLYRAFSEGRPELLNQAVAPTGKAFRVALHEFHHIENGRITHTWHLEDWFGWLNQVGAWPAQKETA